MKERILIVDDDEAIQKLMRVLLERRGYVLDEARDGQEAINRLKGSDYSAILLDLMMPRMNGFEVLRELKAFRPQLLQRIIIFTAASESTLRDFDDSQVFRLIRKPFDIESLVTAVIDCAKAQTVMPKVPPSPVARVQSAK